MFDGHNAGRMCGNILLAKCVLSPSQSAPLGGPRSLFETRGRVGCKCTRAPRIPPSEQQLLAFRNISLSECCARYFLVLSNMFIRHTAGRMCGDIMLAECSSAFSCLWCLRTALCGEPSWLLGCRCTGAPRIPHSDLIRLPSTQHIPTTVILCLRYLGRVAVGCLGRVAVWILGVVPSGLSPHGVASICTLGWGSGLSRVEWSAIYPVPAPHLFPTPTGAPCALTPQG